LEEFAKMPTAIIVGACGWLKELFLVDFLLVRKNFEGFYEVSSYAPLLQCG
jgi:hypothetical protein